MASDQFISLKDVPDIYTDSGSDSSDDESIKALLPTKTKESLSSVPDSSLTTPDNAPSSPLKKPSSPIRTPKSDKSESSSPKQKKSEKRDLDNTEKHKSKKVKQTKPKPPKDFQKPTEKVVVQEIKEEEKKQESASKTPKVKPTPSQHDIPTETGASKESTQSPKKKIKPKKPKSASIPSTQETTCEVSVEPKPGKQHKVEDTNETNSPKPKKIKNDSEKNEKADKPQSSPKRKKTADRGTIGEVPRPQGDSEPKPKKQKRAKNKVPKESISEVKEIVSKPKEGQPEDISVKVSDKIVEKKSDVIASESTPKPEHRIGLDKVIRKKDKKEKSEPLEVLKKMSNKDIFNSLSKDAFDDIPLGSLKAKYMALDVSSGSDTDTDSDSDSDSEDSFIKPRFNAGEETKKIEAIKEEEYKGKKIEEVEIDNKIRSKIEESDSSDDTSDYEDSEEESDEKENLTPQPKLTVTAESTKLSGEQFINKERLQTSFKSKLEIPAGCEIYCGNLPIDISEDELRELFEECGVITRINKLNKKGVAFITFSNEESAQKASEYNNSPYKGQLLNINITTNRPAKKEFGKSGFGRSDSFSAKFKDREVTISNEICIRNLNFNSTEEGLRELFGECGQVTRCYVPKFQDSGKPMGICFITFTTVEAAKRAVEYDQTEIDGRTVSIQYAQPRGNRGSNRGRPLKGRFTTGGSRVSTFSRPIGNSKGSNGTNGSFKEKKDFKNGFVKASEPLNPNVGSVGSDVKPRSIIFEDSDSE